MIADTDQILADLYEMRHDLDEVVQIHETWVPNDGKITEESIYHLEIIPDKFIPTKKAKFIARYYSSENENVIAEFEYPFDETKIRETAEKEKEFIKGIKNSASA
ncbi:MAG: hypothetical protein PHC66_04780 [Candidatus Nanoarchaeia archaeon]|nr:hypothetical protein [Candidatus Nanoarchaeia archaeon]MDD5238983.1 hypothetical protein [Candidatus Nanoarchaeia archaeon]